MRLRNERIVSAPILCRMTRSRIWPAAPAGVRRRPEPDQRGIVPVRDQRYVGIEDGNSRSLAPIASQRRASTVTAPRWTGSVTRTRTSLDRPRSGPAGPTLAIPSLQAAWDAVLSVVPPSASAIRVLADARPTSARTSSPINTIGLHVRPDEPYKQQPGVSQAGRRQLFTAATAPAAEHCQ